MISGLLIHPHIESFADGIVSHCDTLFHLFIGHQEIQVMKPENYPYRKVKPLLATVYASIMTTAHL